MKCSTLTNYEIQEASNNQILVLVKGDHVYQSILKRALTNHFVSSVFKDKKRRFDWGTYIHNVDDATHQQIESLMKLFQQHIFIQDDLTETFALDYHKKISPKENHPNTDMGKLVHQAKPYNRPPTKTHYVKAEELASHFINFIQQHPTYQSADVIIPVPSNQNKEFDLPTLLTQHIAKNCSIKDGSRYVQKVRETLPMKDCLTEQEKIDNVRDAFAISPGIELKDHRVLLIDDIYQTGFTINEVGTALFKANVKQVLGLVATKTIRGRMR